MYDSKENVMEKIVNFVRDKLPFEGLSNEEGKYYGITDLLERTYAALIEHNPLYMTRAERLRNEIEDIISELEKVGFYEGKSERELGEGLENYFLKENYPLKMYYNGKGAFIKTEGILNKRNEGVAYLPSDELSKLYLAFAIYLGLIEKGNQRQHELLVKAGMVSPEYKPLKPYFEVQLDGNKMKAYFKYSTTLPLRAGDVNDVIKKFSNFLETYEEYRKKVDH